MTVDEPPTTSPSSSPHPRRSDGTGDPARMRDPSRVVALTDGVFAIVLTILVLEVAVPPNLSQDSLRRVIDELRPTLVAWVISFLIVGAYWVAHRDLFARLRYANRDLVWLNLLFLLPVSLIPFGASVIGEYPDEPLALHMYGVIVIAAALMRVALQWYVAHRPWLEWDDSFGRKEWLGLVISAMQIPVYLVATAVAGWSTTASVVIFFAGPVLYFVVITVLRDRPNTHTEADEFS